MHAPGNYNGGILEMSIVFDMAVPVEIQQEIAAEITKVLKNHSEVFRNVRLNSVLWQEDARPQCELVPMPVMMLGHYPGKDALKGLENEEGATDGDRENPKPSKNLAGLLDYLKRFHARSKLIFLITDGAFVIEETAVREAMKPFLEKKLVVLMTKSYAGSYTFRHLLEYREN